MGYHDPGERRRGGGLFREVDEEKERGIPASAQRTR